LLVHDSDSLRCTEQANGNTTESFGGRVYTKDRYGYGAVGGLENGLQNITGVRFTARCTGDHRNRTEIWQTVLPGASTPTLSQFPNRTIVISPHSPIPPSARVVISHPIPWDHPRTGWAMMYAVVFPTGSGAYFGVQSTSVGSYTALTCSWKAEARLVFVQTVNFTARTNGSRDHNKFPPVIGRAVWSTLRGMASATREYNASLLVSSQSPYGSSQLGGLARTIYGRGPRPTSEILELLLADGAKAMLALWYHWLASLYNSREGMGMVSCSSLNRTLSPHWRFHNSNNFGWLAAGFTMTTGTLGIAASLWLSRWERMREMELLSVASVFGKLSWDESGLEKAGQLCVRSDRVVQAGGQAQGRHEFHGYS